MLTGLALGPNRLEVRTTRCGRVNRGSIPGSDRFFVPCNVTLLASPDHVRRLCFYLVSLLASVQPPMLPVAKGQNTTHHSLFYACAAYIIQFRVCGTMHGSGQRVLHRNLSLERVYSSTQLIPLCMYTYSFFRSKPLKSKGFLLGISCSTNCYRITTSI